MVLQPIGGLQQYMKAYRLHCRKQW